MDHLGWKMIQCKLFSDSADDEVMEIIPVINSNEPKKVEELMPNADVVLDMYLLYPTGGYHPFFGVPNTFSRYQLPIWPYVKRIKYSETLSKQGLQNIKKKNLTPAQTSAHINLTLHKNYMICTLNTNKRRTAKSYTELSADGSPKLSQRYVQKQFLMHRLVALAWIPNPHNHPLVMHKNDDPSNYLIENLKWGTPGDNMKGKAHRLPDTMEEKYLNMVAKGVIKG